MYMFKFEIAILYCIINNNGTKSSKLGERDIDAPVSITIGSCLDESETKMEDGGTE